MNKSLGSLLILVLVIVLPFLIHGTLQINSLKEDEKMANEIHQRQMETILFSLNQYADDMMDRWVRKLAQDKNPIMKNAADLVNNNEAIQMLVLRQMTNRVDSICINDYVELGNQTEESIQEWYAAKDSIMTQLTQYLDAGYQKIQPATGWHSISGLKPAQSGMTVMLYDADSTLYNALFIFETYIWVEQLLGINMQEIAQDNLRLAVIQQLNPSEIPNILFATESFDLDKEYTQNELWILPNTYLAIQAKGESYAAIIRNRSRNNLYILLSSLLVMLIGTFVIVRNVRKTMKIAQLKSDFVSNVSHEIRTPLSLIKMYAETLMLNRLPSEEKKQHYYQVIHHESGRLTYLVNNILDFSKIEANRKTYRPELHDMNDLVEKLYANYSYSFREKNVVCELVLSEQEIPILVDAQAFEEALSNLIENAIKYSPDNKKIKVSTAIKHGQAQCAISDHGIGISQSNQSMIFDKFFRVEGALTQKTKGTGLGLSLVKHIVESHGGQVTVQSKLHEGSTFTLSFPLNHTEQ